MISGLTTGLLSINEQSRLQTVWSPRQIWFFSHPLLLLVELKHDQGPQLGSAGARHFGGFQGFHSWLHAHYWLRWAGTGTRSTRPTATPASQMWAKNTSTNDIASKPLVKMDLFKVSMSMKVANSKGPMAGLNPVEEVDCFHSNKRSDTHHSFETHSDCFHSNKIIGTHHSLETHRGEK